MNHISDLQAETIRSNIEAKDFWDRQPRTPMTPLPGHLIMKFFKPGIDWTWPQVAIDMVGKPGFHEIVQRMVYNDGCDPILVSLENERLLDGTHRTLAAALLGMTIPVDKLTS